MAFHHPRSPPRSLDWFAPPDIAEKNGDKASRDRYLQTADDWQRNAEAWTFTSSGPLGDHNYFIRIDDNQDPNDGHRLSIANGGGNHDEREIVDAGFLELARLGVLCAGDPNFGNSLPEIDATIKVTTPNGDMFHRYNFDGYGENMGDCTGFPAHNAGTGGLWPLLNGERGEYELANGNMAQPAERLKTMANAANAGFMIPEQVFDRTVLGCGYAIGQATGSAAPLAWSVAQFVRLALSTDAGKLVERPSVVADRYTSHCGGSPTTLTLSATVPASTAGTGKSVFLTGELNKLSPPLAVWNPAGLKMNQDQNDPTHWTVDVKAVPGTKIEYKYTLGDWAFVEKNQSCGEIQNRSVTFSASGQVENDTVPQWRNVSPCGD